MRYIAKDIPLWQVTIWDKKFNNVDKKWQPKTIKYKYLLSDELDSLRVDDGDVRILYTGKDVGFTTEELAGDRLSEGEIISIPWGGIPTVKYHKGKFVTGDNRIATSKDIDKLTNKYLYYFMRGNIHEIASYYRGASLKHPCMKDILKMTISYPSVQEQDKICGQFDVLEQIIEVRKQELQLLDDLIKARFVEMFGDPVSNSNGLPESTLPELGEFGRGISKHRPRNDPKLLGGDYPLIQTGDVANAGLYITSYSSTYSELGLKQSKMWDNGTLCITIAANIAKTSILKFDACFPDSIVGFNANEKTNNIFIHYWFSFFQAILESQAPESAQKNINLKTLSELKVIVPVKDKQDKFVEFIKQVDKSKVAVQKALDETQMLFDSLMQKYFG
ncbi:restriction endonuclease subunit S [Wujia chipingensis]|uniref:Restriction endonuclease subunit S n=1 Tax=Wujia chipingensis TaxID=2763670 RepID=A0A7G9FNT3_9FIRM|nr:restriction endonuclease subunit S [Wujia chipingensis]QNM00215.1 restriction endonuclease subunit S [Wujia chipingensis]